MNVLLTQLLSMLASAFEHIVGDPVHTQSATALKTTLQATAHAVENGVEEGVEALHSAVSEVVNVGRAATAEEWAKLHAAAAEVMAESVHPLPSLAEKPADPPEAPKTAS